jgi:anti-sigma B factor antagonist
MRYTVTHAGDETTLMIEGALDATTAPELRAVVDQLVEEKRPSITLNLQDLSLIDSSGLGVIVSLFKRVRAAGGKVQIFGLRDQPAAMIRQLRLDRVLPID